MQVSTFRFSSTPSSFTFYTLSPSLHSLNPAFLLITPSSHFLLSFKCDSPLRSFQYLALLFSFTRCPSFLIIRLLIFIPLRFFSIFYSLCHFFFVPQFSTPLFPLSAASYRPSSRAGAFSSDVMAGSSILTGAALLALWAVTSRGTALSTAAEPQEQKHETQAAIAKDCNIKHKNVQRL